ncbi:MAG TPA: sodium:solute symporter family protein [Spirochaetales bacterium]|nr:sodium:solute symporter family protein [Spirochaetales bacterium]
MSYALIVITVFLALNFVAGLLRGGADTGSAAPGERFASGGRGFGGLALFATLAATNFSAYTVFGLSGAGFRLGWAWYPAMGFGTGLMALSFLAVGLPVRRFARKRGWATQGALVAGRLGSPALGKALSLFLLVLTVPYLAAQGIAAGRLLESALGLPYALGSALVLGVATAYVLAGGMRAVVRTDVLQFGVLAAVVAAAFAVVARSGGGLEAVSRVLDAEKPALLSSRGGGAGLGLGALAGTWLLWLLADPMFPQLFHRFGVAKDERALRVSAALYPLATAFVFLFPVAAGVVGAALLPGLDAKGAENVFHTLARSGGGEFAGALFVVGALAALLSTLDSQLLAVASIVVEDFMPRRKAGTAAYRAVAALAALAAWLVSLDPPASILDFLNRAAFPGYAAAAPVVLLALYAPRWGAAPAWAALASGAALVALEAFGLFVPPLPQAAFNLIAQGLAVAATAATLPLARRFRPLVANAADGARLRAAGSGASGDSVARSGATLVKAPAPVRLFEHLPPRALAHVALVVAAALAVRLLPWPATRFAGLPVWVWAWIALGGLLAGALATRPDPSSTARTPPPTRPR